jgi:hypothetical protein
MNYISTDGISIQTYGVANGGLNSHGAKKKKN